MTRVMNLHTILQVILELSVKSPSVSRPKGALAHYPLFQGYQQSDEIWVWNVETQHLMHKVRE